MGIVVEVSTAIAAIGFAFALWTLRRERVSRGLYERAVLERAQLMDALTDSEQRSKFEYSIFQSAPLSMIATDRDGFVIAMNRAAEKLSGYSREELVGSSLAVLHDDKELEGRAGDMEPGTTAAAARDGIDEVTAKASDGEIEEEWWTY